MKAVMKVVTKAPFGNPIKNAMNHFNDLNGLINEGSSATMPVASSLRRAALGTTLTLSLFAASLPAMADHHQGTHDATHGATQEAHGTAAANGSNEAADEFVNAEVRKIDAEAGKLTLKHEAIPKFNMAGMTMAFRLAEPSMLDGLAVNDRVRFIADKRNGQFVIVRIEKLN